MNTDPNASAREKLLNAVAAVLEVLYEPVAVPIIASLTPAMMRPGGARVLGTSYELDAPQATALMQQLLALQGGKADALLIALAEADVAGRAAAISGAAPPVVSSLYGACATVQVAAKDDVAIQRLHLAVEQFFTLTQSRRIDALLQTWWQQPRELDAMPVQKFVAQFVRNAPP